MTQGGLSFVGKRLPAGFQLRLVVLPPGAERRYDSADWRDTLVIVERGAIELEPTAGGRLCLFTGAILWLDDVPIRGIRNRSKLAAVLVTVTRDPGPLGG